MKRLAARKTKFSLLTTALVTGSLLLSACQGGGFNTSAEATLRPSTSSDPKTALDLQKLQDPQAAQRTHLGTPVERDSFINDLTGQKPTYSDEEIAQDAEDQYQKELEKQREKKKKHEHQKQSGQPSEQQESDQQSEAKSEPTGSDQNSDGSGYQPEKPSEPVAPPSSNPETSQKPQAPEAKPQPQPQQPAPEVKKPEAKKPEAKKPEQPKPKAKKPEPKTETAKPTQPAKPAEQAPAPAPASGNFCGRLKVATGRGEMDLRELYNDNSQLAKSMPTAELENLRSEDKKNRFVCALLPIAIRMEEVVYKQRREVLRLEKKQRDNQLTSDDQKWLSQIKKDYNLTEQASFKDLLARVDIIPLPLLLSMAALESGWGTSKVARTLKNLFGMHGNPKSQACGYIGTVCVRKFDSISEGVSAYIQLLNRGPYQKFRDARAKLRAEGKALDSETLIAPLAVTYNENPAKYVRDVTTIMNRDNNFGQFVFREEQVEVSQK